MVWVPGTGRPGPAASTAVAVSDSVLTHYAAREARKILTGDP